VEANFYPHVKNSRRAGYSGIIPALKRLRQEDEFETSLGYMARLSQKKKPIS
jgi:hypothetical protein